MNVKLAYLGKSALVQSGLPGRGSATLSFAPNLARDAVAFDAPLKQPLRFREATSALHDVVISDLRFQKRGDKAAYEAWKQEENRRLQELRRGVLVEATKEIEARRGVPIPPDLTRRYEACRKRYWGARVEYSNYLRKHDADLWRMLMPCDPVVTIAEDAALFECFSADESSYGCLNVARDAGFGATSGVKTGTTNVDYSWDLYSSFQALRSYRETRFRIDPAGFTVATEGQAEYREEKIDLPQGWLRGFMQIQGAMALPARRVSLSREAVYSVIAWHRRNRAKKSPRALRFELQNGKPPRLVLEPWEEPIVSHATRYDGPDGPPIRVWGVRRLVTIARLLPLAERIDVYLLGTGLPSFWVAIMGEMRFTLGLSGWTMNDWTRGSALDLVAPRSAPRADLIDQASRALREKGAATLAQIEAACGSPGVGSVAAALNHLAHAGQAIFDLPAGLYQWRQIMPRALGEAEIGPDSPELKAAKDLSARGAARILRREEAPKGGTLLTGKVERTDVELLIDQDGVMRKGTCPCSHHFKGGLRMGPCRHLLALKFAWQSGGNAGGVPPRSEGNAGGVPPRSEGNAGGVPPRSEGNAGGVPPRSEGNAGGVPPRPGDAEQGPPLDTSDAAWYDRLRRWSGR